MAGQPRDRSSRIGRKSRAVRAAAAAAAAAGAVPPPFPPPSSDPDPAVACSRRPNGADEAAAAAAAAAVAAWRYCTAEQLEEQLLKRLDDAYAAALDHLVELGYDDAVALRAVLRAGHCHGKLDDPVANIVENALSFLSNPEAASGAAVANGGFADLRRLEEYSLAGLVCLLQNKRPSLSRADAMWCLLASELRVEQANSIDVSLSALPAPRPSVGAAIGDDSNHSIDAAHSSLCHFHAAAAAASPDSALFDPAAFMRLAMRQSPAAAAGFISALKASWTRTESLPTNAASDAKAKPVPAKKLSTEELIESVVFELEGLNIQEKKNASSDTKPDPKNEMVHDLVRQVREMEAQLKERKEWAQQKAVQAARKLSSDLTELRVLRMEREENQRRKKEKQVLEDETMKRLAELENALKKMSGQVDRANAAVRRLEMENAEIRAEMEAAKLSASESARACQGLVKKEKKVSKKLDAWERQKEKLQEEIINCKAKIKQTERELFEINKTTKEIEVKIREDIKVKERNIALVDEERRAREAAKSNADRRIEALRQKIEIDSQRFRDDIRRLQEELNRLQMPAGLKQLNSPSTNASDAADKNAVIAPKEPNRRPPLASSRPEEPAQRTIRRRECVICKREEACVILLQCAHQVLCFGCSKLREERGEVRCPCCNAKIDERIRVFGAGTN